MKKLTPLLFLPLLLAACDGVKQKAKQTISVTGETLGQSGTEFAGGISEGVSRALNSEVVLSQELQEKGLQPGKFKVRSESGASTNHILTLYLIFGQDFSDTLQVRVLDSKGREYGRSRLAVSGKKAEARYVDFVFDTRTEIESRSRFLIDRQ